MNFAANQLTKRDCDVCSSDFHTRVYELTRRVAVFSHQQIFPEKPAVRISLDLGHLHGAWSEWNITTEHVTYM